MPFGRRHREDEVAGPPVGEALVPEAPRADAPVGAASVPDTAVRVGLDDVAPDATGLVVHEPGEDEGAPDPSGADPAATPSSQPRAMIPARARRRTAVERVSMRLIATAGIVGIGTAIGAILISSDVEGWITGLAVSAFSVAMAALLWSSRQL